MEHSWTAPVDIAGCFLKPDRWLGASVIGSGNINDTYRVDFELDGRAQSRLLQRLNHQVFTDPEAVMQNIAAVAEFLSRQPDFPLQAPAPQAGIDGRLLQRDAAGNYWRMFPFYDHSFVPEKSPAPAVAAEAAAAYGSFLKALRHFPADLLHETIPGFHDTDRRWAVFLNVVEADPANRLKDAGPEVTAMFKALPVFEAISRLKKSGRLPIRVTHNDTKAGNVLLDIRSGKAIAVIDWDTVMPGTVLSDFGDMVRSFAPDFPEDHTGPLCLRLDALQALYRGFLSETADFLTPVERESLTLGGLWITGEQALRFLTDYLAGDVYYKVKSPVHNLERARNQLELFAQLQAHVHLLESWTSPSETLP